MKKAPYDGKRDSTKYHNSVPNIFCMRSTNEKL